MPQLLDFFLSPAHASTTAVPQVGPGGNYGFLVVTVAFLLFMYFMAWRPQNKRAKEQRQLLEGLAKGDEVITTAGILGRITRITEQYIGLTLANNVEVTMQKAAVAVVLPKGTIKSIE